jgi:hypothetical protein
MTLSKITFSISAYMRHLAEMTLSITTFSIKGNFVTQHPPYLDPYVVKRRRVHGIPTLLLTPEAEVLPHQGVRNHYDYIQAVSLAALPFFFTPNGFLNTMGLDTAFCDAYLLYSMHLIKPKEVGKKSSSQAKFKETFFPGFLCCPMSQGCSQSSQSEGISEI